MKPNLSLWLVFVIVALLAISGCFFRRSITYSLQNRQLILQNDSLISVNIELNRQLQLLKSSKPPENKKSMVLSR